MRTPHESVLVPIEGSNQIEAFEPTEEARQETFSSSFSIRMLILIFPLHVNERVLLLTDAFRTVLKCNLYIVKYRMLRPHSGPALLPSLTDTHTAGSAIRCQRSQADVRTHLITWKYLASRTNRSPAASRPKTSRKSPAEQANEQLAGR